MHYCINYSPYFFSIIGIMSSILYDYIIQALSTVPKSSPSTSYIYTLSIYPEGPLPPNPSSLVTVRSVTPYLMLTLGVRCWISLSLVPALPLLRRIYPKFTDIDCIKDNRPFISVQSLFLLLGLHHPSRQVD